MFCRVTVAPPVEPLSLTEVKLNHKVEDTLRDDLLNGLIVAAREYAENYCQLSLVQQTREVFYDAFGGFFSVPYGLASTKSALTLPYGPVSSVVAVEYVDTDGNNQTVSASDYDFIQYRQPSMLVPAFSKYWPVTRYQSNAITLRYIAGYPLGVGSPTDYTSNIPRTIKTAMQLLIGHWLQNAEATTHGTKTLGLIEIPLGVEVLLGQHRVSWL